MQPGTYIALAEERSDRFRAEADCRREGSAASRGGSIGPINRLIGWLRGAAAATPAEIHRHECVHEGRA